MTLYKCYENVLCLLGVSLITSLSNDPWSVIGQYRNIDQSRARTVQPAQQASTLAALYNQ